MNSVKLVAVFVENKPGETARITSLLAGAGVNIRWVTIATSEKFGVMKFLVDKSDAAVESLKDHGASVSLVEVVAVEVKDKPGMLHTVAKTLADAGVNVENISGFVANNRAVLVIELRDPALARAALQKQGIAILTREAMMGL